MYTWRIENKKDYYNTLVEYWTDWEFPILPYGFLPEDIYIVSQVKYGFGRASRGEDLYAIPVFETNSGVAWIGFPTSNRKAPKEDKEGAFKFILSIVEKEMMEKGYCTLLTTSMNPKLINEFENAGFIASDEGTTFYTKNI